MDPAISDMLVQRGCLKLWQFVEFVDDIKDWTGILASMEPAITDRTPVAALRRAYKAAVQRDEERSRWGKDKRGEDMDAPIDPVTGPSSRLTLSSTASPFS